MIASFKKHIGYYISLLIILAFGFLITVLASPNKQLQMVIIVLTTFFYIIWGVLHHLINHDLTVKIMVEYILIGSFGMSAVFFILKAGFF